MPDRLEPQKKGEGRREHCRGLQLKNRQQRGKRTMADVSTAKMRGERDSSVNIRRGGIRGGGARLRPGLQILLSKTEPPDAGDARPSWRKEKRKQSFFSERGDASPSEALEERIHSNDGRSGKASRGGGIIENKRSQDAPCPDSSGPHGRRKKRVLLPTS